MRNKIGVLGKEVNLETKKESFISVIIVDPRKSVPENVKEDVFRVFYPVALSGFGHPDTSKFQQDVMSHLFDVDMLMLVFGQQEGCEAVAFRTFSTIELVNGDSNPLKIIYTNGTVVRSEYQGYGLYQAITRAVVKNFPGYDFITSRTQNPVLVTALHKIFGKVIPVTDSPDGTARAIGVALAQRFKMLEYDPERMICRGTYGGILTGVMPRSFNDIEKKVLELIDPENGDSILLVCSLR